MAGTGAEIARSGHLPFTLQVRKAEGSVRKLKPSLCKFVTNYLKHLTLFDCFFHAVGHRIMPETDRSYRRQYRLSTENGGEGQKEFPVSHTGRNRGIKLCPDRQVYIPESGLPGSPGFRKAGSV